MKTKEKLTRIIAPFLVASAISIFIIIPYRIFRIYGINDFFNLVDFMPKWVVKFVGAANVLTFLPSFILGFINLGQKGAVGQADKLRTWSVYKYLRNPMYAGISFTIFGLGCFLGITSLAISGVLWLIICFLQTRREEKKLLYKFGKEYVIYKNNTPRFIPDFQKMISSIL
ncbi:MAG: hypothetical protein JXB17_06505 [Bacteroidales bacterium]|nr:hypothetical protein [Bacteroidales bacterium]